MKKIFCDCCGKEFLYDDPKVKTTNGKLIDGIAESTGHHSNDLTVEVQLSVAAARNGPDHKDICGDCRWKVIDSIDPRIKVEAAQPTEFDYHVFLEHLQGLEHIWSNVAGKEVKPKSLEWDLLATARAKVQLYIRGVCK